MGRAAASLGEEAPTSGVVETGVSFALPLAGKPIVHLIALEEGAGEPKEAEAIKLGQCTGTNHEPGAAEGNLCVFEESEFNLLIRPQIELNESPTSHRNYGFTMVDFNKAKGALEMRGNLGGDREGITGRSVRGMSILRKARQ